MNFGKIISLEFFFLILNKNIILLKLTVWCDMICKILYQIIDYLLANLSIIISLIEKNLFTILLGLIVNAGVFDK